MAKYSCLARLGLRRALILSRCASQRNASANYGAAKPRLKKRPGICCATETWTRSFAASAASKTGWSISTALNIGSRSNLMVVFILSPAKCGKTLRKRIIQGHSESDYCGFRTGWYWKIQKSSCAKFGRLSTSGRARCRGGDQKPLTRPAPAGENAGSGPPSPQGRGQSS